MADEHMVEGATPDVRYTRYHSGEWSDASTDVPAEMALSVYVNGLELVTVLCTPVKLKQLVFGLLLNEGVIDKLDDVAGMRMCEDDWLADVLLSRQDYTPPQRRTVGSGCGGGVAFDKQLVRVESSAVVTAAQVSSLMRQLNEEAALYRHCGGVHTAGLAEGDKLLIVAEDIGRHNTIDKIAGESLLTGQPTDNKAIVATGRISSEMLSKAARMRVPIVISRSSPTDRAISLAGDLGITLVGYARGDRLSVYSHPERLEGSPGTATAG